MNEIALRQKGSLYRYEAFLVRVLDGDTIEVILQLGLRLTAQEMIRLYGVNSPELHGASREEGLAARAFTQEWLGSKSPLYITSEVFRPFDAFGRILASVYREGDPVSLNDSLVASGHAVVYFP